MEFLTTLIKIKGNQNKKARQSLVDNCTHVTGGYYIMEGDVDCLRDDGVVLEEIEEGAVPSLVGLSDKEMMEVCQVAYGVNPFKL